MEHPYLFLVQLLEAVGAKELAQYPYIIYSWLIMLILIILGSIAVKGISMIPSKSQNIFELVIKGLEDFMVELTGEEGRWFFPIIATIFIYVFACNLIGLVPGCFPPTANINTTASCAVTVFVVTHFIGLKYHGVKYIKHFLGPVILLAPLMFVIELIGHFARVLSLSFRLFGNMMGHELVLMILFGLGGLYLIPLPIMAMGIFVSFVQAFVFFLLSVMYFTGAMEHAH